MKRFVCILLCLLTLVAGASAKQFTVVIDAGHGGKDPGALGKRGREKDINLRVAKEFGRLVRENMNDVKVVFTRDDDVFVPLQDRSAIANRANGDLFVSIHVNASKTTAACGAETYTIGLAKSDANFEVAKRENSVILLEDGYKERYQGFDPRSPESYIMFEFMQSKFSDQSIEMAAYIQDEFIELKRYNRGVRQENFWVLHQTKMPSVLIELGFISNPDEEKYLLSDNGNRELANAIYKAFARYKHEFDRKNSVSIVDVEPATQPAPTKTTSKPAAPATKPAAPTLSVEIEPGVKAVYKLQIFTTSQLITDPDDSRFKGLKCDYYEENGAYKYTYGENTNLGVIQKTKAEISGKFPQAFIVAFYKGKKITLQEAKTINSTVKSSKK
ncbi:MAG: N-acetylmuramoyl-L-alanine amidase [Bacteroidales bacterium]|nr:N-acetylmuramoyl-L-alanine amidase [Bacteroidales bacterium]